MHTATPDPTVPGREVSLRRVAHDDTLYVRVLLHPRPSTTGRDNGSEVYASKDDPMVSHWVGTVRGYEGSLRRKVGRRTVKGKRRRLWEARRPGSGTPARDFTSRADAIRHLLDHADRADR